MTARSNQRRRREGEVLSPQQRRHGDVAPRLELAVGLQDHTPAQPVLDEDLLGLGDTPAPGQACMAEESGEAPVPPSWPEMVMWSALAFATPAAIVPTPPRRRVSRSPWPPGWRS